MLSLQELESQVASLSEKDLAAFRAWFDEFEAEAWDREIAAYSDSGTLDDLMVSP